MKYSTLSSFIWIVSNAALQTASLPSDGYLSEEEILREWTQEPSGFPQNDPWALPLTNGCPAACDQTGLDSSNWTQLYDREHLSQCNKPLLFTLNVYNTLGQYSTTRSCALAIGKNNTNKYSIPLVKKGDATRRKLNRVSSNVSANSSGVLRTCGGGEATVELPILAGPIVLSESSRTDAVAAADLAILHLGAKVDCSYTLLFVKYGNAVAGIFAGADVNKKQAAQLLLQFLPALNKGSRSLEICNASSTTATTLGIFTVAHLSELDRAQEALKLWASGECLSTEESQVLEVLAELGVLQSITTGNSSIQSDKRMNVDSLPDMRLKPRNDGSCHPATVQGGDGCWALSARYGITEDELNLWNKNSWGWAGCGQLQPDQVVCVSSGSPPMPTQVDGITCGPQKPGTAALKAPFTAQDLAKLNPCPLNACCSGWGFCGTTAEFCTSSPADTGNPGTHKPGTASCISNCNMNIIPSAPPSSFFKIGYFQGYGVGQKCNRVDIRSIDISKYTHLHFAFATIKANTYEVDMGPTINQFYYFKQIRGPKKILSFGGWTFSTDPTTYGIFRTGVQAANRQKMAKNIASFIIDNDLDGVDIDWEYPAASDIPGIPAADKNEGIDYLLFLIALKKLLPSSKTVSFAAPASYWYLKGFPILLISKFVDYVIYMTYDLHGQWDFNNKWSDPGCPGGNCLRSHINMTETINALSMITKAGVPANQIVVGVTSYGRSFKMTAKGCTGPMCTYQGPESGAAKENVVAHSEIHFGYPKFVDDAPRPNIYIYMYCDQQALPSKIKDSPKQNVRCVRERDGRHIAASTFRYPGALWSEYYILFCPVFLNEEINAPIFGGLHELAEEEADKSFEIRDTTKRWASGIRAVTMFHEVCHFQDVSNPHCDGLETYDPKEMIVKARSGVAVDGYDDNIRNAHSWAVSAVCMWVLKRYPGIRVPWPKGFRGRPPAKRDSNDSEIGLDEDDSYSEKRGDDDTVSGGDEDPDITIDAPVDQFDGFDPSQVNPAEFTYLSAIDGPTHWEELPCTEGLWDFRDQCDYHCRSGINSKCEKADDEQWRCSGCNSPAVCKPGKYDSSDNCRSNCKDGTCLSTLICDPVVTPNCNTWVYECQC